VAPPSERFQLDFLSYIQRLFDEGEFTATYKYALLMALADLAVERGRDSGDPLTLNIRDIAGKFVRYYWRQARPYVNGAERGLLHQNTGAQARIVNLVRDAAAAISQTAEAPYHVIGPGSSLVREVAQTIRVMPLWKLQTLNGQAETLLYPHTMSRESVVLNPGVSFCFRRFHGLVTRLAQDAWIRFVRNRPANQPLLGEAVDLGAFLFGSERADLDLYRPLLVELQGNACFYCAATLGRSDVDHFIPWSRYPHDLGHNFVLACAPCNHSKRDLLANRRHRESWERRNEDRGSEMTDWYESRRLPHDLKGTRTVAEWAYAQAAMTGARLWTAR
jgi:5-methylcytosine-specific restriction endonuclease McrA